MLSLRLLATAILGSTLAAALTACFGTPARKDTSSTSSGAGGAGGAGASAASSGTGGIGTGGGAAGTGGAGTGGAGMGGAATVGSGTGAGPSDAGILGDVAADALGHGGLPLGALCGQLNSDASTCGEGLACCYPCKGTNCDPECAVACNPMKTGCVDGCLPMP